jgi:formamidopyrimidine-DNA glycosylase
MPEGPEVRRHADALDAALRGEPITAFTARTRDAKAWLATHGDELIGKRVERVYSHGKNLVGLIQGGYFWYAHLLMWGCWLVVAEEPVIRDRRERARISTPNAHALLFSAPVFQVGQGDVLEQVPYLTTLGPDILPYPSAEPFAAGCFVERLQFVPDRTIGAALLDQRVAAGIGNYLRAEILFVCRLDPWRRVGDLTREDLECLSRTIPVLAMRAYQTGGATLPEDQRERMRRDRTLVYPGSVGENWANHHYVFRRTNLPCLVCGDTIRQKRQVTYENEEGEKERITYFCPTCQNTTVDLKPSAPRRRTGVSV